MSTTGSAFIRSDKSLGEMRTLPLIAVSKAHEWLRYHERGQNALTHVKGPSVTNEHSDSRIYYSVGWGDRYHRPRLRHPLKSPVVIGAARHGTPWRVRASLR